MTKLIAECEGWCEALRLCFSFSTSESGIVLELLHDLLYEKSTELQNVEELIFLLNVLACHLPYSTDINRAWSLGQNPVQTTTFYDFKKSERLNLTKPGFPSLIIPE